MDIVEKLRQVSLNGIRAIDDDVRNIMLAAAQEIERLRKVDTEVRKEFIAAINFSADHSGLEASQFLQLWREGCWPEIRLEFPEFKGPFPSQAGAEINDESLKKSSNSDLNS